jgi:hypothetical protein
VGPAAPCLTPRRCSGRGRCCWSWPARRRRWLLRWQGGGRRSQGLKQRPCGPVGTPPQAHPLAWQVGTAASHAPPPPPHTHSPSFPHQPTHIGTPSRTCALAHGFPRSCLCGAGSMTVGAATEPAAELCVCACMRTIVCVSVPRVAWALRLAAAHAVYRRGRVRAWQSGRHRQLPHRGRERARWRRLPHVCGQCGESRGPRHNSGDGCAAGRAGLRCPRHAAVAAPSDRPPAPAAGALPGPGAPHRRRRHVLRGGLATRRRSTHDAARVALAAAVR